MTGFSSLSGDDGQSKWDWEIRSLNGRGLDLRVRLPEGFEALEPILRAEAKKHLTRGSVTVALKLKSQLVAGVGEIDPSGLAAALSVLKEIEAQAHTHNVTLGALSASDVAAMSGVLKTPVKNDDIPPDMKGQIPQLFDEFVAMRCVEGQALGRILKEQLERMSLLVDEAAVTAEARAAKSGAILREKVGLLLGTTQEADPERLQQELAILAVKSDVSEEIDRLKAHIKATEDLLRQGGPVGRKLDFLMQEFNREANTLCSKSGSTELTALGMDLKVLIDQMREQIQNLE